MEDYEIRDVMNRAKHPVIDVRFEITKEYNFRNSNYSVNTGSTFTNVKDLVKSKINGSKMNREKEIEYYLDVKVHNIGNVTANQIAIFIKIPKLILHTDELIVEENDQNENLEIVIENKFRDIIESGTSIGNERLVYSPYRYEPLLPKLFRNFESVKLNDVKCKDTIISWIVQADNAPRRKGTVLLNEIKVIE